MAIHELYQGGPASANSSRAMFPAPLFAAGSAPFATMRPSAHKAPGLYKLSRTLDFRDDPALKHWVNNATIAQGDDLGILVIPQNLMLLGVQYQVARAAGVAMTLTPTLRVNTGAFPAINGNALATALTQVGVAGAITATGTAATIVPWYIATPEMYSLDLTAWTDFGVLRLEVTALVVDTTASD